MHLPTDPDELRKTLLFLYDRTRDEMADWREEAVTYYKAYDSYVDKDQYPLQFKLFFPICFAEIDTTLPKFANGLIYRRPLMQVRKLHPSTPDASIMNARRILNGEWMTDADTLHDMMMGIKEAKLVGWSGFKTQHVYRVQKVKRYKPVSFGGVRVATQKYFDRVAIENRPRIFHCDSYDLFPDLSAIHERDRQFVCHAFIKSLDEIEFGPIKYENVNELKQMGNWDVTDTYISSRIRDRFDRSRRVTPQYTTTLMPREPRLIQEFVVREYTKQGEVIHLITLGNRKVFLRHDLIQYWPYNFMRNNPDPHVFIGRSDLQPILPLNLGYNDIMNMSLENMLMALTKMFIVGDGAGIDKQRFAIEPGGIIHVDDINQIKVESWADINPSSLRLEKEIISGIERVAQGDYSRGATPQRKEFATTVLAIQQAADIKIDASIKHYEKTAVSPIAKSMINCAQEYLADPAFIANPTSPTGFDQIDMYDLQGLMDFELAAAAMGMSELRRSQLHDFSQDSIQLLGPQADLTFRLKILKAIADTYDGLEGLVSDVDKYILQLETQAAAGQGQPGTIPDGSQNGTNGQPGMAAIPGNDPQQAQSSNTGNVAAGRMEPNYSMAQVQ